MLEQDVEKFKNLYLEERYFFLDFILDIYSKKIISEEIFQEFTSNNLELIKKVFPELYENVFIPLI